MKQLLNAKIFNSYFMFSPSAYCTSMLQGFTSPSARLASRLHAFATNLHE